MGLKQFYFDKILTTLETSPLDSKCHEFFSFLWNPSQTRFAGKTGMGLVLRISLEMIDHIVVELSLKTSHSIITGFLWFYRYIAV